MGRAVGGAVKGCVWLGCKWWAYGWGCAVGLWGSALSRLSGASKDRHGEGLREGMGGKEEQPGWAGRPLPRSPGLQ